MLRSRFVSVTSLVLLVGVMAGCGTSVNGVGDMSVKAIAKSTKTAAATTKAAAAKTTTTTAAKPAAVAPVTLSAPQLDAAQKMGSIAAAGAGNVKVTFAGLGGARKLMALEDQIASVTLTLGAANGSTQTRQLNQSQLSAGSVEFDGVPVGAVTLSVSAFDVTNKLIGQASSVGQVVAQQTIAMPLTVHIAADTTQTGNVAATITFVQDGASPTPAPAVSPTPTVASTPTPVASTPSFLSSTAPTAAPTVNTMDIWGRLYDYSGNQLASGTVRYTSTDANYPYDQTATLRSDGYYYMPAVPTGVTIQVTAQSDTQSSSAYYTFTYDTNPSDYANWLDLFVSATTTSATPTPGWWW